MSAPSVTPWMDFFPFLSDVGYICFLPLVDKRRQNASEGVLEAHLEGRPHPGDLSFTRVPTASSRMSRPPCACVPGTRPCPGPAAHKARPRRDIEATDKATLPSSALVGSFRSEPDGGRLPAASAATRSHALCPRPPRPPGQLSGAEAELHRSGRRSGRHDEEEEIIKVPGRHPEMPSRG